jgi:hypothetical protein
MPQRGLEKVANRDRRHSVLLPAGFEAHELRLGELNLRGVFDQQDALVRRMNFPSAFNSVVLPVLVPPQIRRFRRCRI